MPRTITELAPFVDAFFQLCLQVGVIFGELLHFERIDTRIAQLGFDQAGLFLQTGNLLLQFLYTRKQFLLFAFA